MLTRITAAEGAAMIQNDENVAFSGFTPNGVAKAVIREVTKKAICLHDAGEEYKIGVITGASSCQSVEGDLAKFRGPFSTNADFRKHTNLGEIDYEDMHLGHVAERLRRGFYGQIDWALIEVSAIEEKGDKIRVSLTTAGGIVPTIVRLAKKIILELNTFHSPVSHLLHDVYECAEYPNRLPIPMLHVGDRIGVDYIEIDKDKIVGVVESNIPEEARAFKGLTPETKLIGEYVVDFFIREMKAGRIPDCMFPIQSGVGVTGNAVLEEIGHSNELPPLELFSEVIQDSSVELIRQGKIAQASCAAMTCTNECIQDIYKNIDLETLQCYA